MRLFRRIFLRMMIFYVSALLASSKTLGNALWRHLSVSDLWEKNSVSHDDRIPRKYWSSFWGKNLSTHRSENWRDRLYGNSVGALGINRCPNIRLPFGVNLTGPEFSFNFNEEPHPKFPFLMTDKPIHRACKDVYHWLSNHRFAAHGAQNTGTNLLNKLLLMGVTQGNNRNRVDPKPCLPWVGHTSMKIKDGKFRPAIGGKHERHLTSIHSYHDKLEMTGRLDACLKNCYQVVIVKHPLTWIKSICKKPYDFRFNMSGCPHPEIIGKVRYRSGIMSDAAVYQSLAAAWNDYYGFYASGVFRNVIIIRYEDLLYEMSQGRARGIEKILDQCGGMQGVRIDLTTFHKKSLKVEYHKEFTLMEAVNKYGDVGILIDEYTSSDFEYLGEHLDKDVMELFNYNIPI